jgi:hypothetical protein
MALRGVLVAESRAHRQSAALVRDDGCLRGECARGSGETLSGGYETETISDVEERIDVVDGNQNVRSRPLCPPPLPLKRCEDNIDLRTSVLSGGVEVAKLCLLIFRQNVQCRPGDETISHPRTRSRGMEGRSNGAISALAQLVVLPTQPFSLPARISAQASI